MKHSRLVFLFLMIGVAALAEDRFWRDERGGFAANTEARSAVGGFGGWLVVTSDSDWQAKWETSPSTVPRFTEAKTVARGKPIFILTFFANPKLTESGAADVTCDIDVVKPDGTSSVHQVDAVCFRGELKGPATNVYLSAPILNFVGESNDPAGKWLVRVTLKDNIRHMSLPLRASFILIDERV
jgi:Flp pilus assembly protein TadG